MRRPWFCRHRQWMAANPLMTVMPDGTLSITWTELMCVRCGKMRHNNVLKPQEELVVHVETWDEG